MRSETRKNLKKPLVKLRSRKFTLRHFSVFPSWCYSATWWCFGWFVHFDSNDFNPALLCDDINGWQDIYWTICSDTGQLWQRNIWSKSGEEKSDAKKWICFKSIEITDQVFTILLVGRNEWEFIFLLQYLYPSNDFKFNLIKIVDQKISKSESPSCLKMRIILYYSIYQTLLK